MCRFVKILLMPMLLILNILLVIAKGILYVAGGLMNLAAIICVFAVVIGLLNPLYSFMVIPALISAYLLSPFGIQLIAIFLTVNVELLRDWVQAK